MVGTAKQTLVRREGLIVCRIAGRDSYSGIGKNDVGRSADAMWIEDEEKIEKVECERKDRNT
jgi:hypothetical protein